MPRQRNIAFRKNNNQSYKEIMCYDWFDIIVLSLLSLMYLHLIKIHAYMY